MNNNFSLYPYNYWILYAALIALLVFLIMTAVKAKPLLEFAKEYKPVGEKIASEIETSKEKAEYIQNTFTKESSSTATYLKAFLIFSAINKDYKRTKGKGIKDFNKSAIHVFANQESKRLVSGSLRNLFH